MDAESPQPTVLTASPANSADSWMSYLSGRLSATDIRASGKPPRSPSPVLVDVQEDIPDTPPPLSPLIDDSATSDGTQSYTQYDPRTSPTVTISLQECLPAARSPTPEARHPALISPASRSGRYTPIDYATARTYQSGYVSNILPRRRSIQRQSFPAPSSISSSSRSRSRSPSPTPVRVRSSTPDRRTTTVPEEQMPPTPRAAWKAYGPYGSYVPPPDCRWDFGAYVPPPAPYQTPPPPSSQSSDFSPIIPGPFTLPRWQAQGPAPPQFTMPPVSPPAPPAPFPHGFQPAWFGAPHLPPPVPNVIAPHPPHEPRHAKAPHAWTLTDLADYNIHLAAQDARAFYPAPARSHASPTLPAEFRTARTAADTWHSAAARLLRYAERARTLETEAQGEFLARLLDALGFADALGPRAIVRTRPALPLVVCAQPLSARALCAIDAGAGHTPLIVVARPSPSPSPSPASSSSSTYPSGWGIPISGGEASGVSAFVALAVGSFQASAAHAYASHAAPPSADALHDGLPPRTYAGVIATGALPVFATVTVTAALARAVRDGARPPWAQTVVAVHAPRITVENVGDALAAGVEDSMRDVQKRQKVVRAYEEFREGVVARLG